MSTGKFDSDYYFVLKDRSERMPEMTPDEDTSRKRYRYEEIYLHAYDSVSAARRGIGRYIAFYNTHRPHSALDKSIPDEFYFASLPAIEQAA